MSWERRGSGQERLSAAIEIARAHPPSIVEGDAVKMLPELIARAPADATLCVYGTHTLYQFPRETLIGTLKAMQDASDSRPIHFVSIEGTGERWSELSHTVYRDRQRERTVVARCNPHGRWLEWLAPG